MVDVASDRGRRSRFGPDHPDSGFRRPAGPPGGSPGSRARKDGPVTGHPEDVLDRSRIELVASRSSLAELLDRRLEHHGLHDACPVLVAVSGGVDSTALLAVAAAISRRRDPARIRPIVAHVDHALRPESADDATAVARLAEVLELPFMQVRIDWSAIESAGDSPSSADARDARWDALASMAETARARVVLAGHHGDDQAETVLLRLARGVGLDGLSGIPEQRMLGDACQVIRPFLTSRRAELAALVEEAGIGFRHDPTNDRRDRAREMIRHEILPRLESIHPGAAGRIAALAAESNERPEVGGILPPPWDRGIFRSFDESMVMTLLRTAVSRVDPAVAEVARSQWRTAARMIIDPDPAPRRLRLTDRTELKVNKGLVDLEVDSPVPGVTASS
ncbi:MAG: tRNA lysidine(34) synthetase TilS [Phycisphaera sp. TMED9]|nr:MAG: tRNA lysidine(34) synthetase TilS [Phycisphaera sp. TMED9]